MTPQKINNLLGITDQEAELIKRIARHESSPVSGEEPSNDFDAAARTLRLLDSGEDESTHDDLIEKGLVHYWDDGDDPISKLTSVGFQIYQAIK